MMDWISPSIIATTLYFHSGIPFDIHNYLAMLP